MRVEQLADGVTLYNADCRDVLPTLGRVDAVVTDPPYGMKLNTDYSGFKSWTGEGKDYGDIKGDDQPFDPVPWLDIAPVCLFWGAQYFASKLPDVGGWLVFNKRGDGKPSSVCFGDAELAWCNSGKQSVRLYSQMWHGVARWRWSAEGAHHPTQKSIGLMEWCIEQIGKPKSILDPYMGSGTTGVAAVNLGRKFVGIEIEPRYFDIACRRIDAALKQPALFVEPSAKPVQKAMDLCPPTPTQEPEHD